MPRKRASRRLTALGCLAIVAIATGAILVLQGIAGLTADLVETPGDWVSPARRTVTVGLFLLGGGGVLIGWIIRSLPPDERP